MRFHGMVWILLILAPVSLGASGRAWNPYGLSEDEVDALRVRHPALREFAEFFTALLRHEDAPRDENFAVYRPIRRLAMRRRSVRGTWSPDLQDGIQGQVSQALWKTGFAGIGQNRFEPGHPTDASGPGIRLHRRLGEPGPAPASQQPTETGGFESVARRRLASFSSSRGVSGSGTGDGSAASGLGRGGRFAGLAADRREAADGSCVADSVAQGGPVAG